MAPASSAMALPTDPNPLFWPREVRAVAFQNLDQMPQMAASRTIAAGGAVHPLPAGAPLDMGDFDLEAFMEAQGTAAIVVVLNGEVVLERYGLGFGPTGRWTSFSVAKSLNSTLVGAAVLDGAIESLSDPVSRYIPDLAGSAYDDVTIRQLLTMTSGVRWNENYSDPQSDVSRFNSHVPEPGMDATVSYMRTLPRENEPGTRWRYSTGEANLIGVLVSSATGKPLADYLSEKIWRPYGMQQDATWLLGPTGHEIAGCCVQAATRDMARFGLFVLGDGMAGGERVVPEGWFAEATSPIVSLGEDAGYGYQWWTYGGGTYAANGIFGQGLYIDPARDLVIATNANWPQATGGEAPRQRAAFIRAVQAAVDARAR
ncbi:beta-lactamase [Aurantiacibacter luteus]|uniref:Beta-lactamase n=1 Tax=Aurantiacibacter luteus TaxID=1581420 RepID=A0A0G9N3J4_9SPHN|nr:beta-lactamase [Aurantiacibacter luteus]